MTNPTPAPPRMSANGEHGMPCDKEMATRLQVHLDGDMLRHVLAYDMAEGWVEHIEHDENGFLVHCDGEWSVLRRFGRVEAILRE